MSEQHHVGLDVSVKETAICIVDPHGKVVHRATVESHPEAISRHLIDLGHSYARVGLEAGPLSPWLYAGLVEAGLPAICVETRHAQRFLSTRPVKTDKNDARGIAEMMRIGHYRPSHVKSLRLSLSAPPSKRAGRLSPRFYRSKAQSRPAADARPQSG